MSHPALTPSSSRLPSPESPLPDLAALAVTLQTAAQALARYCEHAAPSALQGGVGFAPAAPGPARSGNPRETDSPCGPAITAATTETGATRCYHFSASALRHERELLKKYHAEDFRGLIVQTNTLLVGVVKLMKSVHPDARMRGYVVSSLGCLLEQAATLTLRMHNVYSRVDVVDAPAPA